MTDQQHPITPPPELVSDWAHMLAMDTDTYVFTQAARWGADQELEACCEWIGSEGLAGYTSRELRAARRPKPPSLKEQALKAQQRMWDGGVTREDWELVRRALEQLDD